MKASEIRRLARDRLSTSWGVSIGTAAVAALLGGLLFGGSFLPQTQYYREFSFQSGIQLRINTIGSVLGLASFLLGGLIQLGYAKFLLFQYDESPAEFGDLFSEVDRYGTGFAQAFLRSLYTTLWTLLFIIPGVIARLSYAMTPFILEENPDMTASEAIRASKELMQGHKMDLFVLELSFLGWALLAVLTFNLGFLVLNPYLNAAYAVFYRQISGQRRYRDL